MEVKRSEIKAKTETILYTVIKYCDRKLMGLPDILADKKASDFPAIETAALEDLMQNNCATMDFNGKIKIKQEFLDCIKSCSRCEDIVGIDIKRPNGRQEHTTVYYMGPDSDCIILRSIDGEYAGVCGLYQGTIEELMNMVSDYVDAKDGEIITPKEYYVGSSTVNRGSIEEICRSGCSKKTAQLISDISKGMATALITKKIRQGEEVGFFSAIWGRDEVLEMRVEYADFKENIVFMPISKKDILSNVRKNIEI